MEEKLFDGHIFNSLNFLLHGHHLDLLLWDHFLVVLLDVLDGVVIGHDYLPRNFFHHHSLLVLDYFSFDGHSLHVLSFFVFGDLALIGHVGNAALTFHWMQMYL